MEENANIFLLLQFLFLPLLVEDFLKSVGVFFHLYNIWIMEIDWYNVKQLKIFVVEMVELLEKNGASFRTFTQPNDFI